MFLTGIATWKVETGGSSKLLLWFRKFVVFFALTTIPYFAIATELLLSIERASEKWEMKNIKSASFINNLTDYEIHIVYRNTSNKLQVIDVSQIEIDFAFHRGDPDELTIFRRDSGKHLTKEEMAYFPVVTNISALPVKVESDGKLIEYIVINPKKAYALVVKGTIGLPGIASLLQGSLDIRARYFIKIAHVPHAEGKVARVMKYGAFELPLVLSTNEKSIYSQ